MKKIVCVAMALFFMIGVAGTSFANVVPTAGTSPAITTGTTDALIPVIPPGPPPKK
ncbi:MAG: hypothetical protein PHI18_07465 [bacterium]|nr:hypothetical protein [bacterium]